MDVLLHIGMQKSGSTAIQTRFAAARDWLAARGLHYPQGLITPHNQSLLVALASRDKRLPRHHERVYGRDVERAIADMQAWWDGVRADARAAGARRIVLSAETLFRIEDAPSARAVAEMLRQAGGRLDLVAYLRRPSEQYVGLVQQRLKAGHVLIQPRPTAYRAALETWEGVADSLAVRLYDRAAFPEGDIARAFLAEAGEDPGALPPPGDDGAEANVSLGAEGMAILQDYRARFHPRANRRHKPDSAALLQALSEAEAVLRAEAEARGEDAPAPPRLLPDLADRIDHGSHDLSWLRERWGIVFAGIDYARIAPAGTFDTVRRVADICPVDPALCERLMLGALAGMARRMPPPPRPGAPAEPDPVRERDRAGAGQRKDTEAK
ncbi:hypothetical protein [Wenxinia marina]|uniref:Uncharacterized protein n=1 Tax=Wenxinia marina DSM 24838 TaxID=1123501 RepID=A0A0D0QGM3_9RHOB|nr:hypothetical protein [Wenxinia marina]KIQ71417.1 hypothetical protein Wenmar_04063 [Wenxinia marina DSM 24838]GGL78844.1 hypothetical protein GCM10011392_36640 [Wenxinia marina]